MCPSCTDLSLGHYLNFADVLTSVPFADFLTGGFLTDVPLAVPFAMPYAVSHAVVVAVVTVPWIL